MPNPQMAMEVSLPLAAQRLGVSGEVARRLVLRGKLSGRQDNGRWVVEEESISRLLQERSATSPSRSSI